MSGFLISAFAIKSREHMDFISFLLSGYNKRGQIDIFLNFVLWFFPVFTMECMIIHAFTWEILINSSSNYFNKEKGVAFVKRRIFQAEQMLQAWRWQCVHRVILREDLKNRTTGKCFEMIPDFLNGKKSERKNKTGRNVVPLI